MERTGKYLVVFCSRKTEYPQYSICYGARFITAVSAEEAEGIALRQLKKENPSEEGWDRHDVCAGEFSWEDLTAHAEQARHLTECKERV